MGFFNKLKKFVTGGGAEVTLAGPRPKAIHPAFSLALSPAGGDLHSREK